MPDDLGAFVAGLPASALAPWAEREPWDITSDAQEIVLKILAELGGEFRIEGSIARHDDAMMEAGAVVKPPAVIGPGCFVASGAYLRAGVWLEADVTVGPGCELKASFVFRGSKLAHFNFVGDSILGADVNLEAGAIVANYRNERDDKRIVIRRGGRHADTGKDKFGALIGDGCRIGANAVIAPGALLDPGTVVARLALIDQAPSRGA